MSFKDLVHGNKPHADSPEQAAARRAAEEEARAKAEAKAKKSGKQDASHAKRGEPSEK